ncbi:MULTISPECIES: MBL fold metallo-hydrolase [Paenibacillus]|uniref:MBL fold hydrolase n=1 Tax=Paenibacillus albilobatus TaxID=2716884 RepID=A0A919XLN2_9BACL|nr:MULTISPECIES: MBL fold metallo-hydrolase [Paenibacillus]KHF33431.1 putative metallo-hydrolase YycJ [Paenibacillus sp. P1XP2]GIO33698.1 MBL fold hydrolase [Paenibacillus albilobatus]
MKVDILASGSSGNCIAVTSGEQIILIDAGIPKTKIEKRLLAAGIRPDHISAICVTHAHKDHVCGLPLANKFRIPVYATHGEWHKISGVDEDLRRTAETRFSKYEMIELGRMHVYPFKVHHDAMEPVGYAVEDDNGGRCCIVLDTGHVDQDIIDMMEGQIIIIEANHDPDLVPLCSRPESVKARILSDIGHLSNEQTAAALQQVIRGRGEQIYLTHLSGENNNPQLAEMTVKAALRQRGFEAGKHYTIEVV